MKYLIATSAFSNPDLLEKCINSLPNNVDRMIVFDGKNAKQIFKTFIETYKSNGTVIYFNEEHLGCSGSWNKIIKYAFENDSYDAVMIIGSDIEMKSGYFESYIEEFEKGNFDFSTARGFGFNCFTLARKCFEVVGLFDENLGPVYYEDNDYATRVRISKLAYGDVGDHTLLEHWGSAVIRKDKKFEIANNHTFPMNQRYYVEKWGIKDLAKMDEYSYLTPFDNPILTIKDWILDKSLREYKQKIWE